MWPCGRRRVAAEMVMEMDVHERNIPESEPSENVEVCGSRRLTAEEIQFNSADLADNKAIDSKHILLWEQIVQIL